MFQRIALYKHVQIIWVQTPVYVCVYVFMFVWKEEKESKRERRERSIV